MSTNINDLPTDPTGGGTIGNISLSINEKNERVDVGTVQTNTTTLDEGVIKQIISGLQQASSTGQTQLASRDIPLVSQNITQDTQIQPNYIPKTENINYIENYQKNDEIIAQYNKELANNNSLDRLYDEIQIPLLISVLYFLFQLPVFKRYLFHYIPVLFSKDGNININGFFFTSTLFGLIYYIIHKITTNFNKF
jgi:hypothetical protein